ncbi:hypothetical protein E2562_006586 [Oryza meyeriana var. granulata]|uniref:Pentacotripeptide-repeat region of PRORP domain-containing protein n=1 Tax=Oryza meyeriana var. granulata TaxID=110450 RepID=A0A6G1EGQ0_9ORYZ|nr:hypothetical protein E2562_006586 [Oryza meyeriana var. granulata]
MWGTTAAAVRRLCAAGDVRSALAMLARGAKAGDAALDVTACARRSSTAAARAAMWQKPGGCSTYGKLWDAAKLLDMMRREGTRPSIMTFNLLVDGYGKAGKMSNALHFFNQMKAAGFQPSAVTYNMLIAGF